MISLKELLKIPHFSSLELVTNEKTLNHQTIKSVEITETPDVANFIPKNVLILSTGMVFKNNQNDLLPFIDSLIEAESVGLGIKLNRFLNQIDQKVIDYANDKKFPLVIIPDRYPLGSLLHQVMRIVLDNQQEEIDFALNIQKSFSNLLIQDASNHLLVRELSKAIKTPIILLDPFKQIISTSQHFRNNMDHAEYYVQTLFKSLNENNRTDGSVVIEELDKTKTQLSLVPIKVFSYFSHYLIIVSPEQVPFPTSIFAIDQAAMVFQFNLYKNQKVDESLYANEAHFFNDLVTNPVQKVDWENWFQVSHSYNYIETNYYQVINIHSEHQFKEKNSTLKYDEKHFLSYCWLREHIDEYFNNSLVIWRAEIQEIVLILQEEPVDLEQKLRAIAKEIKQLIDNQLFFNIGYHYNNWQKIEQSYTQAKMAHDEKNNEKDVITFYKDTGMYQLFNSVDSNEITYFCKSILKDLAYPDTGPLIDLRETLDVYLQNQSEITQTAKDLFIHRNTVNYRIDRCEEILDLNLDSPENSLNIRLALNLSDPDFSK